MNKSQIAPAWIENDKEAYAKPIKKAKKLNRAERHFQKVAALRDAKAPMKAINRLSNQYR